MTFLDIFGMDNKNIRPAEIRGTNHPSGSDRLNRCPTDEF